MSRQVNLDDGYAKIPVEKLREDMVLARDVVAKDGRALILQNTPLNVVNYMKLTDNNISFVHIKLASISEEKPLINTRGEEAEFHRPRVPVEARPEFKEFKQDYDNSTEQVKECIKAISDGDTINLQQLFALTDGIMDKLRCKSDVFTYLWFMKSSDEHTFTHSNNVALLCNLFGRWLGLPQEDMEILTAAGVLHDIGKTKIPSEILNKKGRLTDEEFTIIKGHSVQGYRIIQAQAVPEDVKLSALMHHEKADGSGYPIGLKGEQINRFAKMVSICDIYDAMTANRVYREKLCPFEVIRTFETQSYGALDTEFLLVFLQNIAYTYVGSLAKLSDGREGEIVFINRANLSRPYVRVGRDVIDLSEQKELNVVSLI